MCGRKWGRGGRTLHDVPLVAVRRLAGLRGSDGAVGVVVVLVVVVVVVVGVSSVYSGVLMQYWKSGGACCQ